MNEQRRKTAIKHIIKNMYKNLPDTDHMHPFKTNRARRDKRQTT